jgi:large subunit ribosomal protein L24
MKKIFSNKWLASKQVRKQRKYRANAPIHIRHSILAAHLSKELRKKYGLRSIALRTGDSIKIMRGRFKGKTGKISALNTTKGVAYIEGIYRTRKDGTKVNVPTQTSNLLITALSEDKRRFEKLKIKLEEKKEK